METDTPETDDQSITLEPDGTRIVRDWVDAGFARKLERERNDLAEALREMRYGHTDKAERMAIAALSYLPNVNVLATAGEKTPTKQENE